MHCPQTRMDDSLETVLSALEKNRSAFQIFDKNYQEDRRVFLNGAPKGLKREFDELLTQNAIEFMVDLVMHFGARIEELYSDRLRRRAEFKSQPKIPRFQAVQGNDDWKVSPVCDRLRNRHLDLGDVSPSDLNHFTSALQSDVQGIQVDFDDGHCPTWSNQISGLHNVLKAVANRLPNVPPITKSPVLVLRPRAWNMIERNMSINGKQVPGPIFDFSLLIFHTGAILQRANSGPAFYLSKLESWKEAKLWNDIFSYSELKLRIPNGSIKACVLIENILASFEMERILYELREHSLGLNCGIWDYAASIISIFGGDESFLLPDRNKYVDMNKRFLKKYMELVVRTCHRRGAHATGGMAAKLLPHPDDKEFGNILRGICEAKFMEIQTGVDGFMIYDVKLVRYMNEMWRDYGGPFANQILYLGRSEDITGEDLLSLPEGGVTRKGLDHNIRVSILFNYNWMRGRGHFPLGGSVEDSATAEISRSQIWQWIRHRARIEEGGSVTVEVVKKRAQKVLKDILKNCRDHLEIQKVLTAYDIFFDLVNRRDFPEFITSFIYDEYMFKKTHAHL
ncbi:malate synthase, glyoxysomal-like [Fopius arisanus]|uniref:malate synthase n=1 Tax=Fopius arisanus TaxID=64838 RepID=A0A9R1TMF8_9HYME|nr:PREDICTED: malate synthase, glyoxysomal-like [Fopius arisanus]